MPAAAIIVSAVVDAVVVETGIAAAIASTVGAGVVADVATGALVGAVTSGITGGDIGKGALMGGVGGGIMGQFKGPSQSMEAFGAKQYPGQFEPNIGGSITQKGVESGLSRGAAEAVSTGVGRFAAGTGSGVAGGQDIKTAAERGLISAATGAAKDVLFPMDSKASDTEKLLTRAERGVFDLGVSSLLSPQRGSAGGADAVGSATRLAPTSVATTGGVSPGSEALGQALRLDVGAPIFGGEKDKEGKKSGWNVESLRYMGNTEA